MGKFVPIVPQNEGTQAIDVDEYKLEKSEKQNSMVKPFCQDLSSIINSIVNLESDFYSKMDFTCSERPDGWEERIGILVDAIEALESDDSLIMGIDREEVFKRYLQNLAEIQLLVRKLETSRQEKEYIDKNKIFFRVQTILQIAMSKLDDELVERLLQHGQHDEADQLSFSLSEEELSDFSSSSISAHFVQGRMKNDDRVSEICPINLISPEVLAGIKDIVAAMFMSKYAMECCQSYISVRKDYLDGRLSFLQIQKLSIEDILEMDAKTFSLAVRRWNHALKMFIQVYLTSEKHLSDCIFGDFSESASKFCFLEIATSSVLQLLNFAQAVVIGAPSIEKLFRVLDMYEVLSYLLPDIKSLFPEDCGCSLMTECLEILGTLKGIVKKTFAVLKESIRSKTSTMPFAGGGIHPLTRYIMNYIQVLSDYGKTLNLILDGIPSEGSDVTPTDDDDMHSCPNSTLTQNLLSVTYILESNLEGRSKLYQDVSLQNFFLMNNIHYMVRKVENSDLSLLLGKYWLLNHIGKYTRYARLYERASWNTVLSSLKYEGICSSHGNNPSTRVVKERFRNFNNAFEDIYRTQTSWLISNDDLREELRISIGQMVIQAYRTFHGRYAGLLDGIRHKERYIKYSPEDLQRYLLDLFEGSQR